MSADYQPAVALATHALYRVEALATHVLCRVEALVRWSHPDQGFILPGVFLSIVEQSGLISPLTPKSPVSSS